MQSGVDVEKMHVERSKMTLIRTGIIVATLAAIVAIYYLAGYLSRPSVVPLKPGINQAPAGEVTPYFPTALNLENVTKPIDSYTYLSPDGKITQPYMTYNSTSSLDVNIAQFRSYLASNGWQISYDANVSEPMPHFYATKTNKSVNITFTRTLGGIKVSIAYATVQ